MLTIAYSDPSIKGLESSVKVYPQRCVLEWKINACTHKTVSMAKHQEFEIFAKPLMLAPASVFVSPGGVGQWVTTLYVDGTELLQWALVCWMGGGQAGVRQRNISLSLSTTTGTCGAVMAGYRGTAWGIGLQSRFQTVLLVYLLVHKLVSLERKRWMKKKHGDSKTGERKNSSL